jgi:hypothetical protein
MKQLVILCVVGAFILSGCATTYDRYYYPDGKKCAIILSSVVGTGETELLAVNGCGTLGYSTKDTGISDNGKDAIGKVAEGLAKGAVKGVVPVP